LASDPQEEARDNPWF